MSLVQQEQYVQVNQHVSFESAFECDSFPYIFGQLTTIRIWVNHHPKGDRLVYSAFNTHNDTWTKPKESQPFSFVFLFLDEERNFVFDQCLSFSSLTVAQVLYIAANYYTTEIQKQRIAAFLALSSNSELMRINNASLVWLNEEQKDAADESSLVVPFCVPKSNIWHDNPIVTEPVGHIKVKKPVGRPATKNQAIHIADAKIGDAVTTITIGRQEPPNVLVLGNYKAKDHDIETLVEADVALHGVEATRAKYSEYFNEQIVFRNNQLARSGGLAYKHMQEYQNTPSELRPVVNVSAPHDPVTNNHFLSLDYLQRNIDSCDALWKYLQETEKRFNAILTKLKA